MNHFPNQLRIIVEAISNHFRSNFESFAKTLRIIFQTVSNHFRSVLCIVRCVFLVLGGVVVVVVPGAVAVAAYYIPKKKMDIEEIVMIAITAAATFALLDMYAPSIGNAARQGTGFGIGANLAGFPQMA